MLKASRKTLLGRNRDLIGEGCATMSVDALRRAVAAAAIFAATACSMFEPGDTGRDPSVAITVRPEIVNYDRPAETIDVIFHVELANEGSASLFFTNCGTNLQRQSGIGWHQVWAFVCTADENPSTEIPAGSRVTFDIRVVGILGYDMYHLLRDWTPPLEGKYRLVVGAINTSRSSLPVWMMTSPPFDLEPGG